MDAGWKLRFSFCMENNNATMNTPPQVFMVNQDTYDEHGFNGDPSWGKTEALEDEDEDLPTMEKKPVNAPTNDATKQPLTRMMTRKGARRKREKESSNSRIHHLPFPSGVHLVAEPTDQWNFYRSGSPWICSVAYLLKQGCATWLDGRLQVLMGPNGQVVELLSAGRSNYIGGEFTKGVFEVRSKGQYTPHRLLLDTGAEMNVAGANWAEVLLVNDGPGEKANGLGGVMKSKGNGTMTLSFEGSACELTAHDVMMHIAKSIGLKIPSNVLSIQAEPEKTEWEQAIHDGTDYEILPPQVMMATRTCKFGKLSSAEVIASRTGLTSTEVLESADKLFLGVSKIKIRKGEDVRPIAFRLAYQERRKVNKRSTQKSQARDWKMGECWSGDITPYMHPGHDGYPYAMVFVEKNTGYMVAYPMKDKTTESVIKCIEQLRVFTAASGEGRVLREVRTVLTPPCQFQDEGMIHTPRSF